MESFFTKGFQFEKYINERLLEVSDEGERRALKEVLKETLLPFYDHVENSYTELEERLFRTEQKSKEKYEIITGVQYRNKIDITEEALVPMRYDDLNEIIIDIQDMKDCLQQGKPYFVMSIFIKLEYEQLRRLESEKRSFKATLFTEEDEYPAQIQLKRNTSYFKQIEALYSIFESNNIQWNTVCAPYLRKYFDVHLISTDCPLDEEVKRICIDFQEYQDSIIYDLVPMWNVRFVEQKTGAYPDFAIDRIHYEHCIYKERFVSGRDYLVVNDNNKLWNVFWQKGDMHIICDEANPVNWKLLELGYESLNKNYEMPIFKNGSENEKGRCCIHTIAEVKRFVTGLQYEEYLQLMDIDLVDYHKGNYNTYFLDDFIEDEIRIGNNRPYLIFKFKAKEDSNYLKSDIMSYLVSKMQW